MLPRAISILLGAALFGSAWVWEPRGSPAFVHDLVAGLLVIAIAAAAMARPRIRFANTAIAFWLFFSTYLFNRMPHFYWTVGIGTLLFISSLAAGQSPRRLDDGLLPTVAASRS